MALSTRKKNIIVAAWKTGTFENPNQLAKHFKIDRKTAGNLVDGIPQENAEAVELLTDLKSAENSLKNSLKNPVEKAAVEAAVEERFRIDDIKANSYQATREIINAVRGVVKSGKAQKVIVEGFGDGVSRAGIIDVALSPKDLKDLQDTVDKATITTKINERHAPKSDTNVQTNLTIIKPKF